MDSENTLDPLKQTQTHTPTHSHKHSHTATTGNKVGALAGRHASLALVLAPTALVFSLTLSLSLRPADQV